MRITYRTLNALIDKMSDEQKDSDVTVEFDDECFAAHLRICGNEHDSLDPDHPVLYVPNELFEEMPNVLDRRDDVDQIAKDIGLGSEPTNDCLIGLYRYDLLTCCHCNKGLRRDEHGTLIDNTGGDVCGHDGGNEPHETKE
jgi:hypothetical protein